MKNKKGKAKSYDQKSHRPSPQAGGDSVQGSPAVPVLGEISVWYQHSQCQERFKCSWGLREKRG